MPAPRKRYRSTRKLRPRVTTLLKNLNLSRFSKKLPRGQADPNWRYYRPESIPKALVVKLLTDWSHRRLEEEPLKSATLARACGFVPRLIPHFTYFDQFYIALGEDALKEICVSFLRSLARKLKVPCKVVAVDSAPYVGWANSFTKQADPEAGTGKTRIGTAPFINLIFQVEGEIYSVPVGSYNQTVHLPKNPACLRSIPLEVILKQWSVCVSPFLVSSRFFAKGIEKGVILPCLVLP